MTPETALFLKLHRITWDQSLIDSESTRLLNIVTINYILVGSDCNTDPTSMNRLTTVASFTSAHYHHCEFLLARVLDGIPGIQREKGPRDVVRLLGLW
jgi:hypothetical protein